MHKTKYNIYLIIILISSLFLFNCANTTSKKDPSTQSDDFRIQNNKVKVGIEKQKSKIVELEQLIEELNSRIVYQENMLNTLSEELKDQLEVMNRYNSSNSEVTTTLIKMKNKFEVLEDRAFYSDSVYFEIINDLVEIDSKIEKLSSDNQFSKDPKISDQEYLNRYNNAFNSFINKGDLENSLDEFIKLINLNREHTLADNCQYWIGEVYYKQKLFEQSIFEFKKVFSFKESNKLDDAQYKIILCYMNLGDYDAFYHQINELKNNFPASEYIERTNNLVSKLKK